MNWWAIIIIAFAVGLLPWQIFRYARRRNDAVSKTAKPPAMPERDEPDGFW